MHWFHLLEEPATLEERWKPAVIMRQDDDDAEQTRASGYCAPRSGPPGSAGLGAARPPRAGNRNSLGRASSAALATGHPHGIKSTTFRRASITYLLTNYSTYPRNVVQVTFTPIKILSASCTNSRANKY